MKKNRLIFVVCYAAYTLIYVARLNLSMAASPLKNAGTLTSEQIGVLGSAFFAVYACGRLINGILSERFPARNMIAIGLLIGAAANILFGFFTSFAALLLLWVLNAYAQSMLWSSVLKTVGAVYGADRSQKMSAYMVTSVATGNIAGIIVAMLLIRRFGVSAAFIVPGILLAITAVAVLTVLGKPDECRAGEFSGTRALKSGEVRFMLIPAALHGIMKDNVSLWMAVYVADKFGMDIEKFAFYLLLIPTAGFVGRFLYPPLYRLSKQNENTVSLIGFLLCAAFSLLLIFASVSPVAAIIYLSGIYVSVSLINTSVLSVFPMRFYSDGMSGTVGGLMDFCTYLGAGIGSAVYGVLISRFGYTSMFASWLSASLISVLLLLTYLAKKRKHAAEL